MDNPKHSPEDIFTAIRAIEDSFNRRANNPNLSVNVVADSEPFTTSFTIEVSHNTANKPLCIARVPQVREIEYEGSTLGVLDIPTITQVSDGNSTVNLDLIIPTYYDTDINGKAVTVDSLVNTMVEQIESILG